MANFKYKKIEQWIRDEISQNRFSQGAKIPTEPELMEQFHVSRQTVRSAIEHLTKEGILKKIQGSGTYISQDLPHSLHAPSADQHQYSRSVAMIMSDNKSYIFPDVMRGASEILSRNGFALNVFFTDNDYDMEYNILQNLLAAPPAGIIAEPLTIGQISVNRPSYRLLQERIPVLMIHHQVPDGFSSLSLCDREGAKMLTEYLIAQNHTRIGTIFCMDENTGSSRFLGFLDAMRAHGLHHSSALSLWPERAKIGDYFESGGTLALDRMLQTATAVFCHDDRIAYSLIAYLQSKGIRVPEDISVAGYDDSFFSTLNVPITTVTHPKELYGRNAALALLEMMRDTSADIRRFELEPDLVIRDSVQTLIA